MTQAIAPGNQAGLLGIAGGRHFVSAHNSMDKQSPVLREEHYFSQGNFIQADPADERHAIGFRRRLDRFLDC